MAIQLAAAVRNLRLDAVETTIGVSAVMQIRSGVAPANCAAASTGTVLSTLTLPSNWMNDAASGTKTKNGTWNDAAADATGTAGHFRIFESTATTCHIQGTVGTSAADLIVDSISFTAGQAFTVITFTLSAANA
jgi:hypothetical protein